MQNPTDYYLCSDCFTVYDQEGDCLCDPLEDRADSINWGRYLILNPSLPPVPEEGKTYPLIESSSVSPENLILCLAADDNFLDDIYRDYGQELNKKD